MGCQVGLVNGGAAAILVGGGDTGPRHLFGSTPAHSIWLRFAVFAVIGAAGFSLPCTRSAPYWPTRLSRRTRASRFIPISD